MAKARNPNRKPKRPRRRGRKGMRPPKIVLRAATMTPRIEVPTDDRIRPTKFTKTLGEEFCSRMANGNCLTQLCKRHGDMPTWKTLQRWLDEYPDFKKSFNIAREALYDYWADETVEIADTTEEGQTIKETPAGTEITTGDMLGHRRLRIDARKWLLSKLARNKFGDKFDLNLGGQPGGTPIQYEDIRARNLHLLDQVSARLADTTLSATTGTGEDTADPSAKPGSNT